MAIKKLPNGRWEASYRDPAGRERVKHHRTRTEADRWLTTTKEQLNRGGYVDPRNGKRPLSSFASSWLESAATHVRPKTWTHYESILRIHVLPTFAQQPIAAIGPAEVRGFLTERSKAGAAPGTVRSARKSCDSCSPPPKPTAPSAPTRATAPESRPRPRPRWCSSPPNRSKSS
jgi:hypothetical protein